MAGRESRAAPSLALDRILGLLTVGSLDSMGALAADAPYSESLQDLDLRSARSAWSGVTPSHRTLPNRPVARSGESSDSRLLRFQDWAYSKLPAFEELAGSSVAS